MDKNPLQQVRQALYERLANFDFIEDQLRNMSLFQLVTLEVLLVGHRNYIGTYTCTVRTLQELFGEIIFDKPGGEQPKEEEPKPLVVN